MYKLLFNRFSYLTIGICIILIHLPFINADPDILHSTGRGAFTDEGLYTAQARNFINQNTWDLNNSDALVKTPLFGVSFVIPFYVLGTKLYIARLWVLILSVLFFLYFCNKYHLNLIALFSVPLVFCQFYVFQYTHFSLAEIPCTVSVFIGLVLANEVIINKSKTKLFGAVLAISVSYYLKIQFIYVLAIIPLYLFLMALFNKTTRKEYVHLFFLSFIYSALLLALYITIWYLPNYKLFNHVLEEQSKSKFTEIAAWPLRAKELTQYYFWNSYTWSWSFVLLLIFIITLFQFKKVLPSKYLHLLFLVFIWILLETNKLTLLYAPSRYFISLFFSIGILGSICLSIIFSAKQNKLLFTVVIVSLLLSNIDGYQTLYTSRTYVIKQLDNYLNKDNYNNKTILGTWAAAICWQNKARTLPIWDNYFNYQAPLQKYKPSMLIIEENENDCNNLFKNNNIDLNQISDSVTSSKIGTWPIKIYWLKQNY